MSENFINIYDITDTQYEQLEKDDIKLIEFGFTLMRQVFFGELSIEEREGAWDKRATERREILVYRKKIEIEEHMRKQKEARKASIDSGADSAEV